MTLCRKCITLIKRIIYTFWSPQSLYKVRKYIFWKSKATFVKQEGNTFIEVLRDAWKSRTNRTKLRMLKPKSFRTPKRGGAWLEEPQVWRRSWRGQRGTWQEQPFFLCLGRRQWRDVAAYVTDMSTLCGWWSSNKLWPRHPKPGHSSHNYMCLITGDGLW